MQNQLKIHTQIRELQRTAYERLQAAGVENPAFDIRLILETATGKSRAELIAHDDYELSASELAEFEAMLEKREQRIPISQIFGRKEFYGREFFVDENVLTPRPETEFMVDAAKEIFAANDDFKILDMGIGSGCILLTLLQEFPNSSGVGIDISKKAIAIAEKNRYAQKVDSAELICSDWLEAIEDGANFELIVSNPPYISITEKTKLEEELSFEPDSALFAGDDGLDCYRNIAESINKLNFKFLILEIGQNQENEIIEIFEKQQILLLKQQKDLAGIVRTLVFKNKK